MTGELEAITTRSELIDLTHRHALALDVEDYATLRSLYDPDVLGEFQGHGSVEGYQAMEAIYRQSSAPLDASQHLLSNHLINLGDDEAVVTYYFYAMHYRKDFEGGETFVVGGTYTDTLRRTPAGWRIVQHNISYGWTAGNPSVMAN